MDTRPEHAARPSNRPAHRANQAVLRLRPARSRDPVLTQRVGREDQAGVQFSSGHPHSTRPGEETMREIPRNLSGGWRRGTYLGSISRSASASQCLLEFWCFRELESLSLSEAERRYRCGTNILRVVSLLDAGCHGSQVIMKQSIHGFISRWHATTSITVQTFGASI
jgi:hypothetical protein